MTTARQGGGPGLSGVWVARRPLVGAWPATGQWCCCRLRLGDGKEAIKVAVSKEREGIEKGREGEEEVSQGMYRNWPATSKTAMCCWRRSKKNRGGGRLGWIMEVGGGGVGEGERKEGMGRLGDSGTSRQWWHGHKDCQGKSNTL